MLLNSRVFITIVFNIVLFLATNAVWLLKLGQLKWINICKLEKIHKDALNETIKIMLYYSFKQNLKYAL